MPPPSTYCISVTRADIETPDGRMECRVFVPEGEGSSTQPEARRWPAVILYMDAFGLRPDLDAMAQRLASHGYVVFVPNLYYRSGAYAGFDARLVAAEGPERDRFKGMIRSISDSMVMRDTAGVLAMADSHPAVRPGPVGVVGYCMGGGFALSAAGTFPDKVALAASIHGGSLATDKPDSAHLLAPHIRGRVYVGVAEIDASFSTDQQARLESALTEAGVGFTTEIYKGAKHGFAVNGHLAYDQDASERHWRRLLRLFSDTL